MKLKELFRTLMFIALGWMLFSSSDLTNLKTWTIVGFVMITNFLSEEIGKGN
jgi:hypothetical protein